MTALRLTTELATPAIFGEGNLLLMILQLASHVFFAPITNTVLRYHTEFSEAKKSKEMYSIACLWILKLFPLYIAFWSSACLLFPLFGMTGDWHSRWLLGLTWGLGTALLNLSGAKLVAEIRRPTYVSLNIVQSLTSLLTIYFALLISPSPESFLAASSVAIWFTYVASSFFSGFFIPKSKDYPTALRFGEKVRSYGWHFAYLAVLGWLSNSAERFILSGLSGPSKTGHYVAGFSISSRAMLICSASLCDLFRAPLFNAESRNNSVLANRILKQWIFLALTIGLLGSAFFMLAGPYVASILLAAEYRASAPLVMAWVALAYGTMGVCSALEMKLMALSKSQSLTVPMLIGAISNITIPAMLIYAYKTPASAAMGTFFAFIIQTIATFLILRRRTREEASRA